MSWVKVSYRIQFPLWPVSVCKIVQLYLLFGVKIGEIHLQCWYPIRKEWHIQIYELLTTWEGALRELDTRNMDF